MRIWILPLILLLALLNAGLIVHTASGQQVIDSQVTYTFAGEIDFRAQIQSDSPIQEVLVFMREKGETDTIIGDAQLGLEESVYTYTHNLAQQPLRAFSEIEYWYVVNTQGDQIQESEIFTFIYEDNRFDWQLLVEPPFQVHWYEDDIAFARTVLDAAQGGLEKSATLLDLAVPDIIDIYVYASGLELQSTLRLAGLDWIAGHADPELNLMVVSLPPGPDQRLETERQIPHELMHILLYQTIGTDYDKLPVWFNEGLGSINELRPNPDYYIILNSALEKDNLIPIAELCERFPGDASSIYLAYAQADSFTRFLQRYFGSPGLGALLESYSAGYGCERGTEMALEASLAQLELQWRADLSGESKTDSAAVDLLPWAVILLIVLGAPAVLSIVHLSRGKPASNKV